MLESIGVIELAIARLGTIVMFLPPNSEEVILIEDGIIILREILDKWQKGK